MRAVGLTGLQAAEQQEEQASTGKEPGRQVRPLLPEGEDACPRAGAGHTPTGSQPISQAAAAGAAWPAQQVPRGQQPPQPASPMLTPNTMMKVR